MLTSCKDTKPRNKDTLASHKKHKPWGGNASRRLVRTQALGTNPLCHPTRTQALGKKHILPSHKNKNPGENSSCHIVRTQTRHVVQPQSWDHNPRNTPTLSSCKNTNPAEKYILPAHKNRNSRENSSGHIVPTQTLKTNPFSHVVRP